MFFPLLNEFEVGFLFVLQQLKLLSFDFKVPVQQFLQRQIALSKKTFTFL